MKRDTTVLAVVSGKGGVGKSVVAVNLAESLAAAGHRVALVDADFGQSACAVLLNEAPAATIMDLLRYTAEPGDVRHETGAGLTLVEATTEPGETYSREQELFDALDTLLTDLRRDHDYILIDAPAGVDGPVRWAVDRADLSALVLVGEPTAVADAYRLARMIWSNDASYPLGTIVNFADSAGDASSVADRFSEITERFTGQLPNYLGWVPFPPQYGVPSHNRRRRFERPDPYATPFESSRARSSQAARFWRNRSMQPEIGGSDLNLLYLRRYLSVPGPNVRRMDVRSEAGAPDRVHPMACILFKQLSKC